MSTFERTGFSDQLNIETPEQVELQFNVAGLGSRFVAVLLDHLIQIAAFLVQFLALAWIGAAAVATGSSHLDRAGIWFIAIWSLFNFCLVWGYFSFFEAYWNGQTPGKRAMKLRVVQDSGRQITLFEALARNLLRFVDLLVPGLYLTGVITMMCNKQNKRLGDYVAGTLVVHERVEEQPLLFQSSMNFAPAAERWREQTATMFPADAVAKLNGQDLVMIETFFNRMLDLTLDTRAAIAYRIAGQLGAKMGVAMPEGNPERALESIAYQMRSSGRG